MTKNKITGVYKITNIETNDAYIGSSKDIKRRWSTHLNPSSWKRQPNNKLYQAMKEYGLEKFKFEIIEECTESELKIREEEWRKVSNSTYNKNIAYVPPEERAKHHSENGCKYAVEHKNDEKEKERRNRNSRIWKEKNREKAREATRRWKENQKLKGVSK